jgi:phthalate 4,5-cis-dihydrodiol dehydrogenase
MAEPPPIRLGIAGLGLAGAMMIRAAAYHPRFALAAAADPREEPRTAFARDFGGRTYEDFDALCADTSLGAIYIATPHQLHATQAVAALQAGKHVLVEKPLALTLADCDDVIAAARSTGRSVIVGHTHGFDANIMSLARLVQSGELGALGMILAFNYTDFLMRPRRPDELDTSLGGGIAFNQVTHQIEMVRMIGGGVVRSVRAGAGALEPTRPTEGHCNVFLEFESGATATLIYSAYDFFDSDELHHWIAEGGQDKQGRHGASRATLATASYDEPDAQRHLAYGGRTLPLEQPHLPHFGFLLVTCAGGDIRLSPDGLTLYGRNGVRDLSVPRGPGRPGQGDTLDALWGALREGKRDPRDAAWGKATLEVVLAILRSAREKREILLQHQVGLG